MRYREAQIYNVLILVLAIVCLTLDGSLIATAMWWVTIVATSLNIWQQWRLWRRWGP